MLVVFVPLWFRLVNKVGIILDPSLTKYYKVQVMPEGSPSVLDSYNILKRSCKVGAMSMFASYWILSSHCFIVGSLIIVFTATSFPIPN